MLASGTTQSEMKIALDTQGSIAAASPELAALCGYSIADLIGRPIELLLHADANKSASSIHGYLRSLIGKAVCHAHLRCSNGSSIVHSLSVAEMMQRDGSQLLLTLRPLTDFPFVDWIQRDWRRAFNAADRAIAVCSADGTSIQLANTAFADLYGYSVDALMYTPLANLCAADTGADFIAHTADAIASGRSHFESVHQHRDGKLFPVAIDFAAIHDETGAVAYSIAYVLDISQRKKTEEELRFNREFLQSIFDQAAIAMAICNLEGRFLRVNAALCQMVGYSQEELLSKHFADITHTDDVDENLALREHAQQYGLKKYSLQKRYIHKNGRIIWALLLVSRVKDQHGNTLYTMGQMIDLDKDKATGDRLRWAHDQRDNLVREVHHRIKNNLQSVTGLLRRQISANPAASDALRQAINQVEAIAVVHGLESSADNRRMRICEILCGIIAEANKLQAEVDPIKYPVLLDKPALVRSEEAVPVALILSELLTNAVKHHCPLRALDVRITIDRHAQDEVRIVITNPAEALPPQFDFDAGKGIGQGLKLVRAMVPKKDMRIHFDSGNGEVSVVIALWPPIIYAEDIAQPNE